MLRYTTGDCLLRKAHRGQLQDVKYLVQEVYVDINYRNESGCTALHMAASTGQIDVVSWLLSYQGIRAILLDHNAQSAIHFAAFFGHLNVIKMLLEHCVPLHIKDKTGRLPHIGAAINGHLEVVKFLVDEYSTPIHRDTVDEYGATCLHWAAAHGRKEIVEYLLYTGADAHATSYNNRSAYHLAKEKGQSKCQSVIKKWFEMAQRLLQASETGNDEEVQRVIRDVNGAYPLRFLKDKNGRHAMHWAASSGRLTTLRILGDNFDSWTDLDKFGRNCLHWAALNGHSECALWITQHASCDPKALQIPTLTNKTPSRCALDAGHDSLAQHLLEWENNGIWDAHVKDNLATSAAAAAAMLRYTTGDILIRKAHRGKLQEVVYLVQDIGVDINYRNQNGCTPLHAAAASGQLEVVQWLLNDQHIDPCAVDDGDQTALHYGAFYGHLEVVQILVERGVQLDARDKFGRLPHISAALNGHLDVIRYIVEECEDHVDINAIDEYGGTCLHWAASKGRKEVVQYLCTAGIDIHVTSYDNRTAYQLAKDKYKTKCMQFLRSWYETSQTIVHAAEQGDDETIKRVIAEVNNAYPLRHLRDKNGKNALHWAASTGHLSSLRLLAENFDIWTEVDKFGRNALHWAALGGHKDCAFWLIKNQRDSTAWKTALTRTEKTPSRCAFEAGHSALASQLQAWEKGNTDYLLHDTIDDTLTRTRPITLNRDIGSVRSWLQQLDLGEYTEDFERDGFDTLRGVAMMNEDDLVEMNVKKGHRRGILLHIKELKSQLAAYDDQIAQTGVEPDALPSLGALAMMKIPNSSAVPLNPPESDV